jgi:CHAT domain-containing protein
MRGCGISHEVGARLCLALALVAISSCAQRPGEPIDGLVVFDEDVQLVRGEKRDSAQREIRSDSPASFVAFVYEEDCDVTLRLEVAGETGAPARFSAVNNSMYGESLEVATLDVPTGSRLILKLESGQDFDVPCHSRVRLLRYDQAITDDPRVAARLQALRAWASATDASRTTADTKTTGLRVMEHALAHLESPQGDRWLAAWARLVRADLSYFPEIDFQGSVRDARRALRAFSELHDARNAARSRYVIANSMVEIAMDAKATDPTAEQAAREAQNILKELAREPALSAVQRARAVNFLGIRGFNLGQWREAEPYFREALEAFRRLGDRQGQQIALNNLAAVANELGNFKVAAQYFDELVAKLDRVALPKSRVLHLYNAGLADVNAGNVDRAIERVMLALEWNRELHEPLQDARLMHVLGHAYWRRGDLAQASAFFGEALRLRRTLNDPRGLIRSLRTAGDVAREAGRMKEALKLHREALELAVLDDMRLRVLLDLSLDYAAIPDLGRAVAACREALELKAVGPEYYKRFEVQLALADFLLRRPGRDSAAIAEAESLVAPVFDAALRRYDISMELSARDLRARIFAARQKWPEARAEYERAVGLIFRYSGASTNPELQASAVERARATFRGYVDLHMREAAAHANGVLRPASADEVDALRMLEWARATSFSNARASTQDPASNARIDALLAQMAGKRVRIAALLDRSPAGSRDVDLLQLEIAKLRAEIDRIRAQAPHAASISNASFLGAPDFPALAAGLTQWSYALGNEHVYLWTRDGGGIRAAVLALSPADLERQVGRLAAGNKSRSVEEWQSALRRLASALLPPGVARADAASIEIVADGALAIIPFGALREPGAGRVAMIGSMFHATPLDNPQRLAMHFVGVAGSSGGERSTRGRVFPALAATRSEARAIATLFEHPGDESKVKLLLGSDGSVAALESMWRQGIEVLHVATHGLADLRQPLTSLLMLPARDADGNPVYLTAGQVQEWRGEVKLVYLSACETAVGPARFADGMPGLQRAFLRAGARGVIATLWPVEDVYASQFATDFYRRYTAGTPAARALAETQNSWMQPVAGLRASEQGHRRMTAWAHAYYTQ